MNDSIVRGTIADCDGVAKLHPRFAKALAFLKRPDLAALPVGKYEIDGTACWASVQEAKLTPLAPEMRFEAHRKYIDIQAPLTGPESFGVMTTPENVEGFNEEKDCVLYQGSGETFTLQPGEFVIFFPPAGAHAPCHCEGPERTIRKVVVKIQK